MLGVVLLLASATAVHGQTGALLNGRVVDAETGDPLPGANVFVENTTLGAATDADGFFTFEGPTQLQFTLVASMLSYHTQQRLVDVTNLPPDGFLFRLESSPITLDTVSVVAERPRSWKENLQRFEQMLLSTSVSGKRCRILNPGVLVLDYDPETDVLHATVQQPLKIENPTLGYRITIHDLDLRGRVGVRFQWEGIVQFTELENESRREERRRERARHEAYLGSLRHFLTALVAGRLEEERFGAYYVDGLGSTSTVHPIPEMGSMYLAQAEKPPVLDPAGSTEHTRMVSFTGFVYVRYDEYEPREYVQFQNKYGVRTWLAGSTSDKYGRWPIQSSWLMVPRGSTIIDTRGHEYVDYGLSRHGYWAWERLAEQLPYDYEPPRGR